MAIIPIDSPTPTPTPVSLQNQIYNFLVANLALIVTLIMIIVVVSSIYIVVNDIRKRKGKKALLFNDFNIGKFKIVFFRLIGGKYHEIDRKTIKINQMEPTKFRFNNKSFLTFNIENIGFSDRKNNYYCFDYDTQAQLTFSKTDMPKNIDGTFADVIINRGIVEQLVKGLEDLKPKGQWTMFIIGLISGICIGLVIGFLVGPSIIPSSPTTTPTLTPTPTFYPVYPSIKIGVV